MYLAAFRERCSLVPVPEEARLDGPGVHGFLPSGADLRTRLLVTDDRGYELLVRVLPDIRGGMISVLAGAGRCIELVSSRLAWDQDVVTAMVCRDLRSVPVRSLPDGLRVRRVRRLESDSPDGVPLEDAIAAVLRASPSIKLAPVGFADHLRSMAPTVRLFAAVDRVGVVRATSGAGVFGSEATVVFVNTDPAWRRRGIATAMTSTALRAAHDAGARRACLDASSAAVAVYGKIGFESVGPTQRFLCLG
jgi:GNAT superfamily N-acetyltransferase